MQIEKMTDIHYEYIEKIINMSKEEFVRICVEGTESEMDKLLSALIDEEADDMMSLAETGEHTENGELATEIIDFICGPYEPLQDEED